MALIEPTDPEVIELAGQLHVGEKLIALVVNAWEGNVPEPGEEEVEEEEVVEEEVEPAAEIPMGEGNAPVAEVPLGEGNEAPVDDEEDGKEEEEAEVDEEEAGEKEVIDLGSGWYQVGETKYHGKAALEEAGYSTGEDEEE